MAGVPDVKSYYLAKKDAVVVGDVWYHPFVPGRPFVVRVIDEEGVHSENLDDGERVTFTPDAMRAFDVIHRAVE